MVMMYQTYRTGVWHNQLLRFLVLLAQQIGSNWQYQIAKHSSRAERISNLPYGTFAFIISKKNSIPVKNMKTKIMKLRTNTFIAQNKRKKGKRYIMYFLIGSLRRLQTLWYTSLILLIAGNADKGGVYDWLQAVIRNKEVQIYILRESRYTI